MIKPTVNRHVDYWPQGGDFAQYRIPGQPLAAIITGVHTDGCINVAVFGADGSGPYARKSVPLIQEGEAWQEGVSYATWMPYQQGQAAKTEQVEAELRQLQPYPSGAALAPLPLGNSDNGSANPAQSPGPNPVSQAEPQPVPSTEPVTAEEVAESEKPSEG